MRNRIITYSLVLALSLLQATLVTTLPLSVASINLPLILISSLALGLKPKTALVSAVTAGFVIDLMSPTPFGIHAVSMAIVVSLVSLLVFRVLSHHTLLAVAGVNAGMFLAYHVLVFISMSVVRIFTGGLAVHPAMWQAAFLVISALPVQVILATLIRLLIRFLRRYSGRFILVN